MSDRKRRAARRPPQSVLDEIAAGVLVADGPLVEVEFRAPCPPRPGRARELCPPVRGPALLDTGANRSAFSLPDIVRTGAQPSGVTGVQGVTGSGSTLPRYPGVVSLPGSDLEPTKLDYVVATPHIRDQDIIGVLGRDYLKDKTLAYDGRTGRFVLRSVEGSVDQTATSVLPVLGVVAAGALGVALAVLWPSVASRKSEPLA